jgi:hypothetical protein
MPSYPSHIFPSTVQIAAPLWGKKCILSIGKDLDHSRLCYGYGRVG